MNIKCELNKLHIPKLVTIIWQLLYKYLSLFSITMS